MAERKTSNSKDGKVSAEIPAAKSREPVNTGAAARDGVRRTRRSATRNPSFLASRVTARSQTTLPSGVRKALGLRAGDQIAYEIERDRVVIRKVAAPEEDPALGGFLELLEGDIAVNKERVVFATEAFARYLEELTAGIEVDYDAPIEGDFRL